MITFHTQLNAAGSKLTSLVLCRGLESPRARLNCLFLLSLSLSFLLPAGHRGDFPPPLPTHALSRIGRAGETGLNLTNESCARVCLRHGQAGCTADECVWPCSDDGLFAAVSQGKGKGEK